MKRSYFSESIQEFINQPESAILGELVIHHEFKVDELVKNSWANEIKILKKNLSNFSGHIYLEFSIPRMGKRVDAILIIDSIIFVVEFKVGSSTYDKQGIDQVLDYALDLKNFHEGSHHQFISPILVATNAPAQIDQIAIYHDKILHPIKTNKENLSNSIASVLTSIKAEKIVPSVWENSGYKPTPTIIEAAQYLYENHSVENISRSDAGAINLNRTANAVAKIIHQSREGSYKSICFLTGVPGSGKTLAGLNLASVWHDKENGKHAVFLSGNGPLVVVLREALVRNNMETNKARGIIESKSESARKVNAFIQNIHHFRDDALRDLNPPSDTIVIFDEAQRAWDKTQTTVFMKNKRGILDFNRSEPDFLIGVMDRHTQWATIVCLIGGGQEIHTGEAGLLEWFAALKERYPHWHIFISNQLIDYEYTQGQNLFQPDDFQFLEEIEELHLSVSIRSFRSEKVSSFVKALLDCDLVSSQRLYSNVTSTYPIFLTRNLDTAKKWLKEQSRGTERYGLLASSGAYRLKPFGINVRNEIDPKYWFLNGKDDVRSSYYLEEVATEFDIQGLELDWTCVAWDADLRFQNDQWDHYAFRGTNWQKVKKVDDQVYKKNAYRVLLTRARQGFIIFVPRGEPQDPTRNCQFYDGTYNYLKSIGVTEI